MSQPMAKPGSPEARRLAGRAHDLSLAKMSDREAQGLQEKIELRLGVRCKGCGRRVHVGFRFTSIDPRDPAGQVFQMTACIRDDCDFATRCREAATFVEQVEYAWIDQAGVDAPAAGVVVARSEKVAAAEASGG